MNQKISVIIPIYNTEITHLQTCFKSIMWQKYQNWECILVDDHSTNKTTLNFLNKFVTNNKKFILYKMFKNCGCGVCRNIGFEHSRGDIIFYIDSDDWLEKNAFETIVKCFSKYPTLDILSFDYYESCFGKRRNVRTHRIGFKLNTLINPDLHHDVVKDSQMVWTKAYNANFLRKNKIKFLKDYWYGEDCYYQIVTYMKAKRLMIINKSLINYRRGHKSMTTTFSFQKKANGIMKYYMRAYKCIKNDRDSFSRKYPEFFKFLMNDRIIKLIPKNEKTMFWFKKMKSDMNKFCNLIE